jgi:hypothetical protein
MRDNTTRKSTGKAKLTSAEGKERAHPAESAGFYLQCDAAPPLNRAGFVFTVYTVGKLERGHWEGAFNTKKFKSSGK